MDRVFTAGLTYIDGPWNASMRMHYLGPRALDTLDSVRSRSPTLLNVGARYAANKYMTVDLRITPDRIVADWTRASARQFIKLAKCMRDAGHAEAIGVDGGNRSRCRSRQSDRSAAFQTIGLGRVEQHLRERPWGAARYCPGRTSRSRPGRRSARCARRPRLRLGASCRRQGRAA